MQDSPWLDPRFLFAVAVAVIGGIAWLIRLEGKVNSVEKAQTRQDQSLEDTWKDFEGHRSNEGIHFNQRLASEVDRRQSERFGRIESDLKEIKDLVKGMAGK